MPDYTIHDAAQFLFKNKEFFLDYMQDRDNDKFLKWGNTLNPEDQKKVIQIHRKLTSQKIIHGTTLKIEDEKELVDFLSVSSRSSMVTAIKDIEEDYGDIIVKWYEQKQLNELKEEIRAAAKNMEGVTPIIEQLFSEMDKSPEDNAQHIETLGIVKNALNDPTRGISALQTYADKQQTSIDSVKKVIGGLLLCLAGVLTTALAVAFTGATTALSMGASAPLSLPVGISIASAGVGLLAAGNALIYSGAQKKESTVTQLYKEVLKQQKQEAPKNDQQDLHEPLTEDKELPKNAAR